MKDIIKTTDHRYYEVTLVVAIPDYLGGGDNGYTALDAISQALNDDVEIVVLEMAQTEVQLVPKTAATKPAYVGTTTTTAYVAGTAPTLAKKPTKRVKSKAPNGSKRWTTEDTTTVLELHLKGVSYTEIGKVVGRSKSSVANILWYINKGRNK